MLITKTKNEFIIGCNYWASNAGTEMWNDWNKKIVENDLKKLKEYGIKYLRIFPNWRDFQPVHPLMYSGGAVRDYRLHTSERPKNKYYIDETMIKRFGDFCDLAEKYDLNLIVGLLTGGMSGRNFVPPILYEKELASNSTALLLEQKFILGMVNLFKNKKAIYAWDFGNECNYAINAKTHDEAENWTMTMANAIKVADDKRPLVSGMCGLDTMGIWRIEDQANNVDVLTTHPYPYWVQHCRAGKITSIQTLLHATCETKYYSNIGNKPCLVEEIGTMGPMICSNEVSGNFMKLNMYSNWANGALGVMWWCANEQIHLKFPPYEYQMCEVELGMFDKNGLAKPVLDEVKQFSEWISNIDFSLPKASDDAVCLTTEGQDQWGIAYSSFVLAKQAGANIRFADATKNIPDSKLYLMPSISGHNIMTAQNFSELKDKVKNGAVLYISNDDGILSDFNNLAGVIVEDSETKPENGCFEMNGENINYKRERNYIISANTAEVIAKDRNGIPIFTKNKYGKGTVYYLNFPLEKNLIDVCDGFEREQHMVYDEIFKVIKSEYPIVYNNKFIGITRHIENNREWIVLINYSPNEQITNATLKKDCEYRIIKGNLDKIEPFEMTILEIKS
ncbi:MAG: hypothetical protein SOZ34_03825 [Clostridia bacterium]|nr:hypothetical protein [Clostridia bacterium]